MAGIRAFTASDIPGAAALHREVFKTASGAAGALDGYHAYFTRVFLENPSCDPALPSLVYADRDGHIAGFLGVVPRQMTINGRRIMAAISSQFIVAPSAHAGLVALRLAGAFLNGPQDLSISDEANDTSRRIWEGLGGTTAPWHSLYWTCPLRPARFAVSLVKNRRGFAPLARVAAPFAPLADALAARATNWVRPGAHDGDAPEALTSRAMLSALPRCAPAASLRVDYDERTLAWLLTLAARRKRTGTLRATLVRDRDRVAGWYLYHLDTDRTATVLQVAAAPDRSGHVLDRLFAQAFTDGAIAVSGRVDARDVQALTDRHCVLHRRGPWVLVNARHPELLSPFETGEASFTRFDGEWCLGF
jgi:hypothetical protein